jgi:hypothetical protein
MIEQDTREEGQAQHVQEIPSATCQSIDWYAEGESRVVQIGDVRIEVRMVGRGGRRARIAISAPAGAEFSDNEKAGAAEHVVPQTGYNRVKQY